MRINVNQLKELIRKCTLNYSIESVGFTVTNEKIKSNMISSNRSVCLFIDAPNNMITGLANNDSIEFLWTEPNVNVKPFLNILTEDDVSISIKDEYALINEQIKLHFAHENAVSKYGRDNPANPIEFTLNKLIDDDFIEKFNNIKKVGTHFSKIYFFVKNNELFIESTDKVNKYCNSLKYKLMDVEHEDIQLCFDFKNMVNLITLIEHDDFSIDLSFDPKVKLGCMLMSNSSNTERYYLMSKLEE